MKKRIIAAICMIMLVAGMLIGSSAVMAKSKLKAVPTTIREWIVNYIAEQGETVSSDSQITNYIKNNRTLFFDLDLPDTVTKFDGMSLLFDAMGDETCTVTFNCEEQSDYDLLLKEVTGKNYHNNKCVKFGKTVWDFTLVVDAEGLDVQPRFQRQRPYLKETAHFDFIDAIPESFAIPVPIRVKNNSKEILGTAKPSFNEGGIGAYEKDPTGVKVTRDEEKIVITGLKSAAEISSEYGAVWYTKDGSAPGYSPSANQVSYTFKTAINVLYSVSLEPITDGAKEGIPTLKLDGKLISGGMTPKAEVPDKDEFGRSLGNSASLINRGTNSNADKIGSNANGVDIRTAGRATVPTGTRSTGFAEYGKKIEVAPNPDTDNGFAVAYYNIEIYDPITCELMKSEKNLTEAQLGSILAKGIQGKTKIYVAYTNVIDLMKVDAQGNAIKNLKGNDAPEFGIYTDASCTKLVGKLTYDEKTGAVRTPALDLPVPSQNENVKTYYIKETRAPKGYVINTAAYKLEMQHTASGLVKKLTDPAGTAVAGHGTEKDPYMLVNYKVGYTMVKYRVTQYNKTDISKGKGKTAGDKTDGITAYAYDDKLNGIGGERGFYAGNTVLYNVEFRNTGDVALTINVKDVFEAIAKGGFDFAAVSAKNGNKTLNVNGKDATTFVLPVDDVKTQADESLVVVTFTCTIKKDTPANEEQSTGKTGYAVAGYENTATSTATFVSPYDGKTVVKYAEDKNGNVIPAETTGAILEKSSIAYTPVMAKSVPTSTPKPGNTPAPTPDEPGDNPPKTGDRAHTTLAIILVGLAVVVVVAAVVVTVVNKKKNER